MNRSTTSTSFYDEGLDKSFLQNHPTLTLNDRDLDGHPDEKELRKAITTSRVCELLNYDGIFLELSNNSRELVSHISNIQVFASLVDAISQTRGCCSRSDEHIFKAAKFLINYPAKTILLLTSRSDALDCIFTALDVSPCSPRVSYLITQVFNAWFEIAAENIGDYFSLRSQYITQILVNSCEDDEIHSMIKGLVSMEDSEALISALDVRIAYSSVSSALLDTNYVPRLIARVLNLEGKYHDQTGRLATNAIDIICEITGPKNSFNMSLFREQAFSLDLSRKIVEQCTKMPESIIYWEPYLCRYISSTQFGTQCDTESCGQLLEGLCEFIISTLSMLNKRIPGSGGNLCMLHQLLQKGSSVISAMHAATIQSVLTSVRGTNFIDRLLDGLNVGISHSADIIFNALLPMINLLAASQDSSLVKHTLCETRLLETLVQSLKGTGILPRAHAATLLNSIRNSSQAVLALASAPMRKIFEECVREDLVNINQAWEKQSSPKPHDDRTS